MVKDDDLQRLSLKLNDSWGAFALRLGFRFQGLHGWSFNINRTDPKEQLKMLLEWKRSRGSKATYKVLYNALCHESVKRGDLAAGFYFRNNDADESFACSQSVFLSPTDSFAQSYSSGYWVG